MFEELKTRHILVIGDLIIDEYIKGHVTRISPEAPIPVVFQDSHEYRNGGAANVALNLHNLGVKTSLIGMVGNDTNGFKLKKLIEEIGLEGSTAIITETDRITTTKTRVLAHSQHIVRIDHEETTPCPDMVTQKILESIAKIHNEYPIDLVILQDYEKGLFHLGNITEIISFLKNLNLSVAVDPKEINFWSYVGVDFIKPNKKEAEKALGYKIVMNEEGLSKAATDIKNKLQTREVVITLSEAGIYFHNESDTHWFEAEKIDIVDVCGAGDAVISVLAAFFDRGYSLKSIGELCNVAGRIVCQESGVAPLNRNLLIKAYNERSH